MSDGSMGFCFGEIPGRVGDDVEELAGEVFGDAFYVGVDDGLFAGLLWRYWRSVGLSINCLF